MAKNFFVLLVLIGICFSNAQDVSLPTDFRQHNLSEFNSNLMNPVYSLDRNNPHSIAFWTRYQWQNIDSDPSSLLLNYTGKINERSSMGAGFIQHNTGVFLNTGGLLNYAYGFKLGNNMQLSVGLNVLGYNSELADDRYQPDSGVVIPQQQVSNAFILEFAPGIRFEMSDFGIGMSMDNLIDYNFTTNSTNSDTDEKTFMGTLDYQFPIQLFNGLDAAYLRPMIYVRSVPYGDTQLGINGLLTSNRFWVQGGYNSFYGVSGGIGGRFFKQVSLGALIEVGLDQGVNDKDPSFEIVAAYSFGRQDRRINGVESEEEEELGKLEPSNTVMPQTEKLTKAEALEVENKQVKEPKKKTKKTRRKRRKALEEELALELQLAADLRIKEKQESDALAEAIRLEKQRQIDSVQKLETALSEKIKADLDRIEESKKAGRAITKGHYEEVEKLAGEKAGFYLIVNIYGSTKYRDIFIRSIQNKGINANYFFVPMKKYNYVYLERYDTLSEAEAARDSKFFGKYPESIWIFRIVGE